MSGHALGALGVELTPARPGPGPIPEQILRALELSIGRRVDALLAGDHRSSVLGRGTELAQVRPYVPGDDVRMIDWNVTARTQETHVRVHLAERVLVSWLALDCSPSMAFGTADRRKADVATGVALALAHAASLRGNRVGLLSFGGAESHMRPPRQGRAGFVGLLAGLRDAHAPTDRPGDSLARALERLGSVARQRAFVALVSDFRGPVDWRRPLLELAGRHEVLAVEVRDPREQELTSAGVLHLVDPETGEGLRVDTSDPRLRERFATAARAERDAVRAELMRAGVEHCVVSTEGDWLRPLVTFLGKGHR